MVEEDQEARKEKSVAAAHSSPTNQADIALPPLLVAAASPSIILLERQLQIAPNCNITESGPLGRNAIHIAVISNQPRNVSLLLRAGVDVHARADGGVTPLILASMIGRAEVVRVILEEGKVDPNERDAYQNTSLHAAAVNGHLDVVKVLLERGADPWVVGSSGWTPLQVAVIKKSEEVIRALTQAMESFK